MITKQADREADREADRALQTEGAIRAAEARRDAEPWRFPPTSPWYSRQQVLELVPVAYSGLWAWMRDGKFPQAREIGPGGRRCKIGWLKTEVDEWIQNRPPRVQRRRSEAE